MSDINTGTEVRHALARSAAWGQAAQAGAGHGVELTGHTLAHRIETIPDNSLGRAHSAGADKGNTRVDGTLEGHARYEDMTGVALCAGSAPAPTASGAATFTHTITPAANIDGLCATFVEKRKTYTLEAVLKIAGFTLHGEAGRAMVMRLETQGFDLVEDSSVNTVASFADVTIPDTGNRMLFAQSAVRMNAAAGAALGAGDAVYPNRIEFSYRRGLRGHYTGQYSITRGEAFTDRIDEPVNAGPAVARLKLDFPVNSGAALVTDFKSGGRYKIDVTFAGRQIEPGFNRLFRVEIPNAELAAVTALDSSRGRLAQSAEFTLHEASPAPAGMAGLTGPWRITAVNTRSTSYLA